MSSRDHHQVNYFETPTVADAVDDVVADIAYLTGGDRGRALVEALVAGVRSDRKSLEDALDGLVAAVASECARIREIADRYDARFLRGRSLPPDPEEAEVDLVSISIEGDDNYSKQSPSATLSLRWEDGRHGLLNGSTEVHASVLPLRPEAVRERLQAGRLGEPLEVPCVDSEVDHDGDPLPIHFHVSTEVLTEVEGWDQVFGDAPSFPGFAEPYDHDPNDDKDEREY